MKVLVVAPTLPHPDVRHAGGLYLLRHLEALVERSVHVTLLSIDTSATAEDVAKVPATFELVLADPGPQELSPLHRRWLQLGAQRRWSALGPDAITSLLAAGLVARARDADVVELQWPELTSLVPLLRARGVTTPIVVLEHDVAGEAAPSRARADAGARARLLARILAPLRARAERRDLDAADLVLVFKEPDVRFLRELGVRSEIAVISPPLDAPAGPFERNGDEVLFTGAMWRPENDAAARWLLEHVWPRVRAEVSSARLTIAGASPSAALVAIARDAGGVELTGDVPTLDPYYRRASVFVAPLWTEGGLKFKVPQAMRYSMPVVATTVAAAGIVGVAPSGTLWAVTDDAGEMASALVRALRAPEGAVEVGAAAAAWVAEHHSFDRSMDMVVARYRELAR